MADLEVNRRLKLLIEDFYKSNPFKFSQKYDDTRGIKTYNIVREVNGLSHKMLDAICNAYPEISRSWLLTGEGEPFLPGKDPRAASPALLEKDAIRFWTDISATGGGMVSFEDLNTSEHKVINLDIPEFSGCTDAVSLYGDSMEPRFCSGDIILLERWKESYIEYGNTYLVISGSGHRMVKILRRSSQDGMVRCCSLNAQYDDFEIEMKDILNLYLVRGKIQKLNL